MYRFDGFTEKANNAVNLALEAAQAFGHDYVGSEHMIYGLLKEGTGVAATVLTGQGITLEDYEQKIRESIGTGSEQTQLSPNAFTPRVKRILQTAVLIASKMGHHYVGTEHLLLAVLEDGESYGVRFLQSLGAGRMSWPKKSSKAWAVFPKTEMPIRKAVRAAPKEKARLWNSLAVT